VTSPYNTIEPVHPATELLLARIHVLERKVKYYEKELSRVRTQRDKRYAKLTAQIQAMKPDADAHRRWRNHLARITTHS
jgi:hypothetical protein